MYVAGQGPITKIHTVEIAPDLRQEPAGVAAYHHGPVRGWRARCHLAGERVAIRRVER